MYVTKSYLYLVNLLSKIYKKLFFIDIRYCRKFKEKVWTPRSASQANRKSRKNSWELKQLFSQGRVYFPGDKKDRLQPQTELLFVEGSFSRSCVVRGRGSWTTAPGWPSSPRSQRSKWTRSGSEPLKHSSKLR